ncbi:MAG TPA: bifunctional enoyl-CoA hydratase/phosphate acetyltransferase [Casimicrobiaceae bacterium]|nr:bifunctional enoyl-CoA hydratase/phosphate acetyltransferase [Casimicrobiaceae bacterium]
MTSFTNRTFDEIEIGESVRVSHRLTSADVEALAFVSGDVGPFIIDRADSRGNAMTAEAVAGEALVSGLLQRRLPGPGTTILDQQLHFAGSLAVGDEIDATVVAKEKRATGNEIVFECRVSRGDDELVRGTVTVAAPTTRLRYDDVTPPNVVLRRSDMFARLIRRCEGMAPVVCAVVHPCDKDSLLGPLEAAKRGIIEPVLVGPESTIRAVALAAGVDLAPYRIVDAERATDAAQKAVAMARAGEVQALMKGSLHTDELMAAVVPSASGLRTDRRISHVFVLDVPAYPRMLLVTDAAINVAPTARDKADIVQNAIDLARVLGIDEPRVAILAAVETVNPDMQATVDAAMLCKMADRGQITGGILDGPLAFDNAVSEEAARTKKIVSAVAGKADILLAPDLEAGNMLAKQLQYLAGADSAGIVLGTRVPIVLTSRADSIRSRLASAVVMALLADARRRRLAAPAAP